MSAEGPAIEAAAAPTVSLAKIVESLPPTTTEGREARKTLEKLRDIFTELAAEDNDATCDADYLWAELSQIATMIGFDLGGE